MAVVLSAVEGAIEIYGLYDPETDELRYVGKATDHQERFKRHLSESRTEGRPVNRWVASLLAVGRWPVVRVLETVPAVQWKEAEIRLIAEHRKTSKLLNLADGGDRPSQTKEQAVNAGRLGRKTIAEASPALANAWTVKRDTSKRLVKLAKLGLWSEYYALRFIMRCYAAHRPEMWGSWAAL